MSIDLETTEGRRKYLSEKLDDLLEGITESYGTVLMEELLARLELTIKDFNDEMKDLCKQLGKKEEERQQFLEMLKSGDANHQNMIPTAPVETTNNPFEDFMSSNIEPPSEIIPSVKQTDQTIISKEEPDEELPEWEKKLAKLEKK